MSEAVVDELAIPLCVDLDGSLIRTDVAYETLAGSLRHPATLVRVPFFAARGLAALKVMLAERVAIDVTTLPYHAPLLAWLREEKARGRTLVLATAAAERIAHAVAAHLGVFDEVMASNATVNLRGERKAAALVARFGARGFDYVGNDTTDLAVWRHARGAIIVGDTGALRAAAARTTVVVRGFGGPAPAPFELLRAARPYQWCKNLLVFVPTFTAGAIGDCASVVASALTFVAFSAAASAIYLLNDLTDLTVDRQHPRKRERPFARGSASPLTGLIVSALLLAAALVIGASQGIALTTVAYVALALGYSAGMKEIAWLDITTLAVLYSLRLIAGGTASHHDVSPWLLAFSGSFFLGLAAMKRVAEFRSPEPAERAGSRTAYQSADEPRLTRMGVIAAASSTIILALYARADFATSADPLGMALWPMVALVAGWQARMWSATRLGQMHDDPIVFAATDWVSWAAVGGVVVDFVFALRGR